MKPEKNFVPLVNEYWVSKLQERGWTEMPKFRHIRQNHDGVNKAFLLNDIESMHDFPGSDPSDPEASQKWEATQFAKQMVYRLYEQRVRGKWRVLSLSELEINMKATVGHRFRELVKDMNEVIRYYPHLIQRFWDVAHILRWTIWWRVCGKEEMLKKKKIDNNDIRLFESAPADYKIAFMRLVQDMNKLLYSGALDEICVGIKYQYGGFTRFVREFVSGDPQEGVDSNVFDYTEGDANKWDKHVREYLLKFGRDLRKFCYVPKPGEMSSQEFNFRLDYYYEQMMYGNLVLPSGQVFKHHGPSMLSGAAPTTGDNCSDHLFVCFYAWRRCHPIEKDLTLDAAYLSMGDTMKFREYADDHLNRFRKNDPMIPYEIRAKYYGECGISLSKDKDKISNTIIGHTFLGMEVRQWRGNFVPYADSEKLFGGLTFPPKKFTLDVDFSRTVAYMMLATFGPRHEFDDIRECALQLQNQGARFVKINDVEVYTIPLAQMTYLPTWDDCVKFWTAFEFGDGIGSPVLDELKNLLWDNFLEVFQSKRN